MGISPASELLVRNRTTSPLFMDVWLATLSFDSVAEHSPRPTCSRMACLGVYRSEGVRF